jgi:hypothetical protein
MTRAPRQRRGRSVIAGLVALTVMACHGVQPLAPSAIVRFQLDAPLCSSVIPVQLSVDGALVATDTFRVHLANEHTVTREYAVAAGTHVLSARTSTYVWPDTTVSLGTGQSVTRMLPFYCS